MRLEYTLRRTSKPARFPNAIRQYRLKAGLTQKALGREIGKPRSVISAWERGRVQPCLTNVFRLARKLDTLAEALYAGLYCPLPREKIDTDASRR